MKLIAASALLSILGVAAAASADHQHSLRHRSLQDLCPMDVKECADGSFVSRDPDIGCEFLPCPEEIACAMDVQECDDGTFVSRDPANGCAFKACPKVCTGEDGETYMAPCEGMDGMFCIGESYTALDGCNTCSCGNMDGIAKCTMMACPPKPEENQTVEVKGDEAATTCLVNGLEFEVGQEYTAPDGCNTCTCTDTGESACTRKACEPCSTCDGDDGNTYCAGEAFLSGDGCNTCRCSENGAVSCTKMACPPKEGTQTKDMATTPAADTCLVNGLEIEAGETYVAADGCNTCTCSGGDAPDACTMMACAEPCSTCEDGSETYCAGVSYLSSDGCNTCTCTENGVSACTMMACPDSPAPGVMKVDTTSGAISASVGLSAIVAIGSFLGAAVY